MNIRGWTMIDDDAPEVTDAVRARLDELAEQWSALHNEEEQLGWRRQAAYEDGDEPYFDTEEEAAEFAVQQKLGDELRQMRMDELTATMATYGARLMRPYEHWNEDEAYMQWSERER